MEQQTQYLQRPSGRIAYVKQGAGPLVICAPGMGELKESYQDFSQYLVCNGFTVVTFDLRGHGESDTSFDNYDSHALATDFVAFLEHFDVPATLVGSSMAAGAAIIASTKLPKSVTGVVLSGPFVRDIPGKVMPFLFKLALTRPWGPAAWKSYYSSLFVGPTPDWLPQHQNHISALLKNASRWSAFRATTQTSHAQAEAALSHVSSPTLVIMGNKDPDWKDPIAEAQWISEQLNSKLITVANCGHYPLVEQHPELYSQVTETMKMWSNHA